MQRNASTKSSKANRSKPSRQDIPGPSRTRRGPKIPIEIPSTYPDDDVYAGSPTEVDEPFCNEESSAHPSSEESEDDSEPVAPCEPSKGKRKASKSMSDSTSDVISRRPKVKLSTQNKVVGFKCFSQVPS